MIQFGGRSVRRDGARLQRIRILTAELDIQRQLATDRVRTQETKASFVLVAVGLVVGISFARVASSALWALGLLPVVAALVAAVFAAIVLWPREVKVTAAGKLVDKWVDSSKPLVELDDYILESKRKEIEHQDARQKKSAPKLRNAFRFLLVSIGLVIAVSVINGFLPMEILKP